MCASNRILHHVAVVNKDKLQERRKCQLCCAARAEQGRKLIREFHHAGVCAHFPETGLRAIHDQLDHIRTFALCGEGVFNLFCLPA